MRKCLIVLLIPQYLTTVVVRKKSLFLALRTAVMTTESRKGLGEIPLLPPFLPSLGLPSCPICCAWMQHKSFAKYYHLLLQARSLPASPSPEPESLIMAAGSHQGGGDRVTILASLPSQLPYRCVRLAWACPMGPGVGLWANSRWKVQFLGTHQPVHIWKDSGSYPCQYSPAATSTGFKYSPRFTTVQILKLALCMIM